MQAWYTSIMYKAGKEATCRASRGTPQHQALCLGEGDVAAIREGSDAQAAAVANVLIAVWDLGVAHIHLRCHTEHENRI